MAEGHTLEISIVTKRSYKKGPNKEAVRNRLYFEELDSDIHGMKHIVLLSEVLVDPDAHVIQA